MACPGGCSPGGALNATYTIPGRAPIGGYPPGDEWRSKFQNPRPQRVARSPAPAPASPYRGGNSSPMPGEWQQKFSSIKGQRGRPQIENQTFTIPNPNQTYTIDRPLPGRDDLAESVMDDVGEGDVWNEASAMSLNDYIEGGDESYEGLDDVEPDLYQSQIADESFPFLNVSDETPPFDYSGGCQCEDEADSSDAKAAEISALAEAPSNISVYDAEELNLTTAPRNADWDIPRNRIWQNLSSSLDETEKQEEDSYADFVAGLQTERRDFIETP